MNTLQNFNTQQFKKAARKSVLSIVFFVFSYLLLLALSVIFAIACGFAGVSLMSLKVNIITLGFGIGIIILGIIVFVFLIKFIFKKHVIDRSHLVELEESDSPELYQEIKNIVDQLKTSFPKNIYLSSDVNASVFYDSTFLSMFFPIRKNLQIGLGLVNSVSKDELRSILAHEFGHFSQKSMKVGSYVYTVNNIIFNMLYDNDVFNKRVEGLAGFSYFSIFTLLGMKIVEGIQWLLIKLYGLVNINHAELSREMEFHADAVAASTVGSKIFERALLRLDFSSQSFNSVLTYYENRIAEGLKPTNIYPQHIFLMNLFANDINIEIINNFPNITLEQLGRFNKSKLVISDQWASHPSTKDRISAIEKYNFKHGVDSGLPATAFFSDIENLQQMVTKVLFAKVIYNVEIKEDNLHSFTSFFSESSKATSFPKLFNGYYNEHNPINVKLETVSYSKEQIKVEDLFKDEHIEMIYSLMAIKNDISLIKQINTDEIKVKTFEYDGKKYHKNEILDLLPTLDQEQSNLENQIELNDLKIYSFFKAQAEHKDNLVVLEDKYKTYINYDINYLKGFEIYLKAINETRFIQFTTPFDEIKANLKIFSKTEIQLKEYIKYLILDVTLEIPIETKQLFDKYLAEDLNYFIHSVYKDENLDILFGVLQNLIRILDNNYYRIKQSLLLEMEELASKSNEALVFD